MTMLSLLWLGQLAYAALPLVDFNKMGKVGLAGSFAGLGLFNNESASFDPSTSTLLLRSDSGSLSRLASTNSGGRISAGCSIDDTFYFAGSFSSIDSVSANNVASYSSNSFAPLGSNGPNGEVDAVYCDEQNSKLWVGGSFTSPGASVAVWDTKAGSWSSPPFVGLSSRVLSITSNSSSSSIFFAGSFIASFQGSGSPLNGSNNPNVPFSAGASPFSSSLVPVPLDKANITILGSPSSADAQFSDIKAILCPSGPDGPGNTWFASTANTAIIEVLTFSAISGSGIRLGNTFLGTHGTTGFSVTTIPDNTVRTLKYVDSSNQSQTCSDPCPLSTDSSLLYQDFLFDEPLSITGVQIKLSQFTGQGPGLHILQLLSSGAFASSVDADNGKSCFAPNPSNTTRTGNWTPQLVNTDISGTQQTVLVSSVNVGTSPSDGPSFTWMPYVSAAGDYDINMLVPGCSNLLDCPLRTSVTVELFPGSSPDPIVVTVPQTNKNDASVNLYSGPIIPSSAGFVTTIRMTLADHPEGNGQNGKYELVADRIQLILKSANVSDSGSSGSSGGNTGSKNAFGFFEWPNTGSGIDATKTIPNASETSADALGIALFNGLGSTPSSSTSVAAVAHHASGAIFAAGNFGLTTGSLSGAQNIAVFRDGGLAKLAGDGLNGQVTSMVIEGDNLFVGGLFTDTISGSMQGNLRGVAWYDVQNDQWKSLQLGVNGAVSSLSTLNGQLQVAGNFTQLVTSSNTGIDASGFAVWDIHNATWINSGGFVVGSLTFVGNGTASNQYVAGNVAVSLQFGASGMVMIQNGDSDVPDVTPLNVQLDGSVAVANVNRRSLTPRASWISHVRLSHLWSRQTTTQLAPLPDPLPAPAPAVLAGAFWTNGTTSVEVALIGGNFSFLPTNSAFGSPEAQGVAIYDQESNIISALKGSQINGTVRSLLVDGNVLYVGGQFTIAGADANGFALYDLSAQQWMSGVQALQPASGANVIVRSITKSTSKPNTIIVAGSFTQAGSLRCQSICSLDISSKQWNTLGNGIQGEVAAVAYAGSNQELLIASGSIALSDSTMANVVQYVFDNSSWTAVGQGADIPGPVTALEVNGGNVSSIFAAGKSSDGASFLSFWNGIKWEMLSSALGSASAVAQLVMVPLQDTHSANGVIEPDRMLMVSGSLGATSFGNASAALFDGQTFIPYIVSTSSTGTSGTISSLFHSFSTFSFAQHHFLATGIVILISIAIAAGVVFLLTLIGILWTLFSRRDDKLNKLDLVDEDDDDSTHHRPSSLLEHINAATRTTILGSTGPFAAYNAEKEEEKAGEPPLTAHSAHEQDPFGPDASNYLRAETPSDAVGGIMSEEQSRPAHARYSFDGSGEGELPLKAGAQVEVLDDRDAAWWYARDVRSGREGVVPAAYLY